MTYLHALNFMHKYLVLLLTIYTANAAAQVRDGLLVKKMDMAVELMEQGEYKAAEGEFLQVMKGMETLPSDLAYYFGRNSYHLSKFKQSINWLNKYIQLKGTRGRFYEEAVKYLQLSEDKYLELSRKQTEDIRSELSGGEYDCGGLEKMICPVCHGNGVVIKQGAFDKVYQTCPYSLGESFLSCEEYNLFMRGRLEPKLK